MLHSYEDLLTYLRRQGAAGTEVRAQHAVELPTHAPPVEGALVIFWNPDPQLVQLITARAYFRLVLPRQPSGDIAEEEVGRAARTVMTTLRDFWLPLRAVILGGAAPEKILAAKTDA